MKRVFFASLTILLLLGILVNPVFAKNTAVATANVATVLQGGTAIITISLSDCAPVKTGSIVIETDKSISVQSASWMLNSPLMQNYNVAAQKGVFVCENDTAVVGEVFTLMVKSDNNAAIGEHIISFTFHFRTSAGELLSISGKSKLMVIRNDSSPKNGDVNCDGNIDAFDYQMLKAFVLGSHKDVTNEQRVAMDVNHDGCTDAFDYQMVKAHVLGSYIIQ